MGTSGSATLKFNVHDNNLNNSFNSAVIFNFNDTSVVHGIFEDNQIVGSIGNAGGRGIDGALVADDNSNVRLRVDGNTVTGMRGEGMFFNANNTATLNIQVTNNNITTSADRDEYFENLTVQAASGAANSADIVAKIEGNTVAKAGLMHSAPDLVPKRSALSAGPAVHNHPVGARHPDARRHLVTSVFDANNPGAEPGTDSGLGVDVQPAPNGGGKITVVENGTVLQPSVPLMAAEGGVEVAMYAPSLFSSFMRSPLDSFPFMVGAPASNRSAAARTMAAPNTTTSLSSQQLDAIVAAAIERLSAAGLTQEQLALLRGIHFQITDLPGAYLSEAQGNRISG